MARYSVQLENGQEIEYEMSEDQFAQFLQDIDAGQLDRPTARNPVPVNFDMEKLSSRAKKNKEMTHPYTPDEPRPEGVPEEYTKEDFKAGTWATFGKHLANLGYGIGQLTGDLDPEIEAHQARVNELYDWADQDISSQAGAAGLMLLPDIFASPLAIGTTGAALGKTGLTGIGKWMGQMGKQMGRQQGLSAPPGVHGAVFGGAEGGAGFIDPDEPNPYRRRAQAMGLGATLGGIADVGMTAGQLGVQRALASRKRREVSGDLPTKVRVPGPELYREGPDIVRTGAIRRKPQKTATQQVLQGSRKRALDDIQENADLLRLEATGSAMPTVKGEPLEPMMGSLRNYHDAHKKVMDDQYGIAKQGGPVGMKRTHYIQNYVNPIKKMLDDDAFDTSQPTIKNALNEMGLVMDDAENGMANAYKLSRFQKVINNSIKDVEQGTSAHTALLRMKHGLNDFIDTSLKSNQFHGDTTAIQGFQDANKVARGFYSKYYRDKDMIDIVQDNITPQELSDKLFGAVGFKSKKSQADMLDNLLDMDPTGNYKKRLKSEMYQQLYSGFKSGDEFGMDKFVTNFDSSVGSGKGEQVFKRLLDEGERGKLHDLRNVAEMMKQTPNKDMNLIEPTPFQVGLSHIRSPTADVLQIPFLSKDEDTALLSDLFSAVRGSEGVHTALKNPLMSGMIGSYMGDKLLDTTADEFISTIRAPGEKLGQIAYDIFGGSKALEYERAERVAKAKKKLKDKEYIQSLEIKNYLNSIE